MSPAKIAELIEMSFGLRTLVGPGNHTLDGGPYSPIGRGNFLGGKWRCIVKYRYTLQSFVQKRLNQLRRPLGSGLRWAQGIVLDGGPQVLRDIAMATNFWLSLGYNFGCMIANDTLFDSRGRFSGSSYFCLSIYGVYIDATWQM